MNSQILYISSATSEKMFYNLEKDKKKQKFVYGMPVAANKFHNLIMNGLINNNCNVEALVGLPISNKTHSKKIWHKTITNDNNIKFVNLGFINIPVLKHLCIGFSCMKNIFKWNRKKGNKIIIYDASYVSIIPFIILSNFFLKNKTIAIFSDIYSYMADVETNNKNLNFMSSIMKRLMKHCYKKTYGYVFLSEQMNDLINLYNKPYCVIEGVASSKMIASNNSISNKKSILMYAGALRKEYGLEILVDGFMNYKDSSAELFIYGDGDYIDEIKKKSKLDSRIKYKGTKTNDEIIKLEREVTLLINPRPSNLEFTKYSFPSKLMEYLSSGTAVLTTKLPTIPVEYYDYLFFIEEETKEGITKSLENVLKSKKKLKDFGKKAQDFVKNNKIETIQSKKILDICEV